MQTTYEEKKDHDTSFQRHHESQCCRRYTTLNTVHLHENYQPISFDKKNANVETKQHVIVPSVDHHQNNGICEDQEEFKLIHTLSLKTESSSLSDESLFSLT